MGKEQKSFVARWTGALQKARGFFKAATPKQPQQTWRKGVGVEGGKKAKKKKREVGPSYKLFRQKHRGGTWCRLRRVMRTYWGHERKSPEKVPQGCPAMVTGRKRRLAGMLTRSKKP